MIPRSKRDFIFTYLRKFFHLNYQTKGSSHLYKLSLIYTLPARQWCKAIEFHLIDDNFLLKHPKQLLHQILVVKKLRMALLMYPVQNDGLPTQLKLP